MDIKDTTLNQCNSLQKTLVDKGFRIGKNGLYEIRKRFNGLYVNKEVLLVV